MNIFFNFHILNERDIVPKETLIESYNSVTTRNRLEFDYYDTLIDIRKLVCLEEGKHPKPHARAMFA